MIERLLCFFSFRARVTRIRHRRIFGGVFGHRIIVVVRNALEHGIPGFERIALRPGLAAAEKNEEKKTPENYRSLAKIRHRVRHAPAWLKPSSVTHLERYCSSGQQDGRVEPSPDLVDDLASGRDARHFRSVFNPSDERPGPAEPCALGVEKLR